MKGCHLIPSDASMKSKLVCICMLTTGFALLFAGAVFLTTELLSLRQSLAGSAWSFAQAIASNTKADLAFGDSRNAEETLRALQSVPSITRAVIYDAKGEVFASYDRNGRHYVKNSVIPQKDMHRFGKNRLYLYHHVSLDGETIGTVFIESDTGRFYASAVRYLVTLTIVMILALLFSYILHTRLQSRVARPFQGLYRLMRSVSQNKAYWLRAEVTSQDEVGALARGFNEMLANIQARDEELASYRKHLEELVQKRTAELSHANKQLHLELEERKRIEAALIESEHRYRTIFETTVTASMITQENKNIFLVNGAFEKLSGYSRDEVEDKKGWDYFLREENACHAIESCLVNDSGANGTAGCETGFTDSAGSRHAVYLSAARIPGTSRVVSSILDLTELKQLEAQLLQAQKMEAIGQLAGGIAHDFNNILSAIVGYGSLVKEKLAATDPILNDVEIMLSSAEKATKLTSALLAFSRKQIMKAQAIDLNETIGKMGNLLTGLLTEDIDLKIVCADRLPPVFGAMNDGGILSIRTEMVDLPGSIAGEEGSLPAGPYALITVTDTGKGMSRATVERIFEPFYTTKEVGKGTGLGLSIVYGIINQHHGDIQVTSEIGSGTTFRIYLPVTTTTVDLERVPSAQTVPEGKETIMVVEDDIVTRTLTVEVLKRYGYKVLEAVDGEDALNKYLEYKDAVDLVILDVIMPKKNGKITYEEMKAINGNIKALFVSGYTADIMEQKGLSGEDINFLSKPIVPKVLAVKVREVLDS
jgi:PAS domain S-box-containing protein